MKEERGGRTRDPDLALRERRSCSGDVRRSPTDRCELGFLANISVPDTGEETPILQVLASTDPEFRPSREEFLGGPGGFDRSGYFKMTLRGALHACTDSVLAAVHEWKNRLAGKVRLVKIEQEPRRLFVAAYALEEKGLFRLTYRITPALDRFSLTAVYVDSSGRTLAIEAIEALLPKYQLDRLMTALEGATACERASTQPSR